MSQAEITAILNLVAALLPLIEKGAVTLLADVRMLLSAAQASSDATAAQIEQVQALLQKSDEAQDAAYAAYKAMAAGE